MIIDHVVLWVDDPQQALAFYCDVLGMSPVRAEEYKQGKAPFLSVRLNEGSIFDLMQKTMLQATSGLTGGRASGQALNHVCLSMDADAYVAMKARLSKHGVALNPGPDPSFGAQGFTSHSVYFQDPDDNTIEIRCYDE